MLSHCDTSDYDGLETTGVKKNLQVWKHRMGAQATLMTLLQIKFFQYRSTIHLYIPP
jgi:hypothetical protein